MDDEDRLRRIEEALAYTQRDLTETKAILGSMQELIAKMLVENAMVVKRVREWPYVTIKS